MKYKSNKYNFLNSVKKDVSFVAIVVVVVVVVVVET